MTKGAIWNRKILPYYARFYRQHLTGYERLTLASTASLLGIRETRRILGDYVLNYDDYSRHAIFDDEIGRYNYWIDTHLPKPDMEEFSKHVSLRSNTPPQPGDSYGIPYRCLTPRGLENVLVAGRCVSTDRPVQSSLRVMPGCFITGQATGLAAALMLKHRTNTRGVNVPELQSGLKAMGAFLPNLE